MPKISGRAPHSYRTVFISDIHLGFRGCSADALLDFLRSVESERLYLVGDIIDIWSMRKRPFWPQSHNNVVRTVLGKAKHGTEVVLVPGNHDELLRDYDGMHFGNVRIANETIHEAADGKRYLVLHGDRFDAAVRCSRALAILGSRAYDLLLSLNVWVNTARRIMGWPQWSLSLFVKHKVKNAVQYISSFEEAVAIAARRHATDGVICGHIHHAQIRRIDTISYLNCGDWVESCTALVEDAHGRFEVLRWTVQPPARDTAHVKAAA